jgi:sortase A
MKTFYSILAIAGFLILVYCVIEMTRAHLYQTREEKRFEDRVPSTEKVVVPRLADGSAVARLEIPRLGLSAIVVEGAGARELKLGPGHIRGTASPGEGGNIGVAGHRDTFFRPLSRIRQDDVIDLAASSGAQYRYRVVSIQIVDPGDVRFLYPTELDTLTLVTCYPFHFVGPAPQRFIVRAECTNCPQKERERR